MSFESDQQFESNWWGNCQNTLGEELKQLSYAKRMGLRFSHNGKSPYNIDGQGKKILDIGGGPVSLLLKYENVKGLVIDPCTYPDWIGERYNEANIGYITSTGEDFDVVNCGIYDEALIYNVLQHVKNPQQIIQNARKIAKVIRIFEWIENGVSEGHPNNLRASELDEWLGGTGKIEQIDENTARGLCYSGIFKGDRYDE